MRVRIATAHHGPAILKDLDVIDEGQRAEFAVLFSPNVDYPPQFDTLHFGHGQVMARREADDAADPNLTARNKQTLVIGWREFAGLRGLMYFGLREVR
jgi:hypothetical protein